jgi:hypothetical protein
MSFWNKLFGGGSKPTPVAQPSSSASKAPTCQHDWNGCKCSKCGEIRKEEGGLLKTAWHDWRNNECSKCGVKRRPMTTEYR